MNIESLLSARLFLVPQTAGKRAWFVSNLSGKMSLYAMDLGDVPEPLLPPDIALQNPELVGGHAFGVFPGLGGLLVMIDRDGDENCRPMLVPLDGGYPQAGIRREAHRDPVSSAASTANRASCTSSRNHGPRPWCVRGRPT